MKSFLRKIFIGKTHWHTSLRIALALCCLGFLLVCFLVLSVRIGLWGPLPSNEELQSFSNPIATKIFTNDGTQMGKYYIQNRDLIEYEDLSDDIINALIAAEDSRFYQHNGIDYRAWMRVFFKTILLSDRSQGGGSTLTQQLAKNLYPRDRSGKFQLVIFKLKEIFTARRLEKLFTKEEIIMQYLNTVSFGGNIFGIDVASKQYFNTSASNLRTEEAALLIGLLKATNSYNPRTNQENAIKRRNDVLSKMNEGGFIQDSIHATLIKTPIKLDYQEESHHEGLAPYFRERLRIELREKAKTLINDEGKSYNIYTDGLKVYTSIDANMQQMAEAALKNRLKDLQTQFDDHWKGQNAWGNKEALDRAIKASKRYKRLKANGASNTEINASFDTKIPMEIYDYDGGKLVEWSPRDSVKYYLSILHAGFMVADYKTGEVKAWVGGLNHKFFQFDNVLSKRQTGSVFKPVVYATALEQGWQPCDFFDNAYATYPQYDDWTPKNSDQIYGGAYSMEGALTNSVNVATVDAILKVGPENVAKMAKKMGVENPLPAVPAIALGTSNISLMEMIKIFATVANEGALADFHFIKKIEDRNGKVLFERKEPVQKNILLKENAIALRTMLQSVVNYGTGGSLRYRYAFNQDIAGKTGTTQSNADGWFIGFTPDLIAGAWVGGELPTTRFRTIRLGQGAHMALPIWAKFFQSLYKHEDYKSLSKTHFEWAPDEVLMKMECPHFLDDMSNEWDIYYNYDQRKPEIARVEEEEPEKIIDLTKILPPKKPRKKEKKPKKKKGKLRDFLDKVFKN